PKALTPARLGPLALHGLFEVITCEETSDHGISGLASRKPPVGGSVACSIARIALIRPAAPAASRQWPMLPLTEPMGTVTFRVRPIHTSSIASISVLS